MPRRHVIIIITQTRHFTKELKSFDGFQNSSLARIKCYVRNVIHRSHYRQEEGSFRSGVGLDPGKAPRKTDNIHLHQLR